MELLDMPLELVAKLMEAAVVANGLDQAMKLRLVCRSFDNEVLRAISTTKALEQPENINRYVGERLISGYLLARTLVDTERKHFSSKAIGEAVDYVIKEQPEYKERRVEIISSLCVAAARSYGQRIYHFVNPGHSRFQYCEPRAKSLKGDALAAAAFLNITPLVRKLVQDGARHGYNTCFGDIDCIIARTGDLELIISTLDKKESSVDLMLYLQQLALDQGCLTTRTPRRFLTVEQESKPPLEYIQNLILWVAAEKDHEHIVRHALDNGADPNTRRGNPRFISAMATAVTAAARRGHEAVVRLLVSRGAAINRLSPRLAHWASPPLTETVKGGWVKIAQFLIDHGANDNETLPRDPGTKPKFAFHSCMNILPLFVAIKHGQMECVRLLLENGADISPYPNVGKEAFLYAKSKGDTSIMRLLVQYGLGLPSIDL